MCWCGVTVTGLVRGRGGEDVRIAVGRRLAGVDRSPHNTLGDSEDSPLQQSKRSSMFNYSTNACAYCVAYKKIENVEFK